MTSCILYYLLTGCLAGFSAGLLGVGGGLIIVPVLYSVFSVQNIEPSQLMHMALGTSLATIVITSISSSYAHHKKNAVLWSTVFLLSPGIVLGAWAGGSTASVLDSAILKPVFAVFEFTVAIMMLLSHNKKTDALPVAIQPVKIHTCIALTGGFVIGLVSAIAGIGGGTLTVPFLHKLNVNIKNAVATSAACGLPIALAGTASYIFAGRNVSFDGVPALGYINLEAFSAIIMTSLLFAPLGAWLAHKIPDKQLKKVFAIFLFFLGIKMLF